VNAKMEVASVIDDSSLQGITREIYASLATLYLIVTYPPAEGSPVREK
jgi:hypothetical protein